MYKPVTTIVKDPRKERLKVLKEKPVLNMQEIKEVLDLLIDLVA